MRFKPIPPAPDDLAVVRVARAAVPLVPSPEDDCCARMGERLDFPRERAREWLTFLRALGLVRESRRGFVRTDASIDRSALTDAFRDRVFGAREVLAVLANAPGDVAVDAVAERTYDAVPQWERDRRHDPRAHHRDRVERLLGWAVLFGLAVAAGRDETDRGAVLYGTGEQG